MVPEFKFINQNGELISNSDYLGKVYIVEFFFTTCTTICPIMNTNLVHIQNSFTAFPEFGIASFSINPEYDTVEVLNQYANDNGIVNSNWNLMTGNRDDIYKLANDGFNLYTAASTEFVDGFEHSGYFALVDKNGYIRCRNDQFGNPKIYYKGSVNFQEKLNHQHLHRHQNKMGDRQNHLHHHRLLISLLLLHLVVQYKLMGFVD